jgi:phenylalanyl-tRNA synthetase beta chain
VSCKGKNIGLLTEVAPNVRQAFDLTGRAAAAIIDLASLLSLEPDVMIATALAAFPAVEFDETLGMPKTAYRTLVEKLLTINPLLRSVHIVDLYEGTNAKTITLRFTYRADDRTLTQEEVEKIHAGVLAELKKA